MCLSLSLSLSLSLKNLASDRAAIILHDTNMPPSLEYHKKDGTKGVSWDNKRGVARAVEEFVGMPFNEEAWYVTQTNTHTWDKKGGVARAVEEFVGMPFNEEV